MPAPSPYRLFDVRVRDCVALTPSLRRIVFAGPDLAQMRSYGPDQRIKLFFPTADGGAPALADGPDWYAAYRALPDERRPPMRTYTVRALRPAQGELDVDFVLHGETGPASRWAVHARAGDRLQVWAPCAGGEAAAAGCEWRPPADARRLLIVADETALPAAAGILEDLAAAAAPPRVSALIEIPQRADAHYPARQADALRDVHWLPRQDDGAAHGERLLQALRALDLGETPASPGALAEPAPVDVDRDILWEQAADGGDGFYAWIAGEAGAVLRLRRHLLAERGIDRRAVTFMGYWRQGRALD